ncbi:MAG: WYL domain-containing protein [Bacteroidetes bacterium]|nr:MAG: WYL domain-containing protein [Bacteroidota bacterium]
MVAQQKMLRIFRLIRLLNRQPGQTVLHLARLLEITPRSVYRYLDLLEELGYAVDRDMEGRFFIFSETTEDHLPRLEVEEVQQLGELLQNHLPDSEGRAALLRKLYAHSDFNHLAGELVDAHTGQVFRALGEALTLQVQVRLLGYQSPSSGQVSDRLVEPMGFTTDCRHLLAYEPASEMVKQFKLDRIEGVERLESPRKYHGIVDQPDVFGMSGEQEHEVILNLSLRAYRLLVEEFPRTRAQISKQKGSWPYQYQGTVRAWQGVGRFVLGLPGEIYIVLPEALRAYCREMRTHDTFSD